MAIRYISNKDSGGTSLGQDSADLVSFYGVSPVAQASSTVLSAPTVSAAIATVSVYGFVTSDQLNNFVAMCLQMRTALKNMGAFGIT